MPADPGQFDSGENKQINSPVGKRARVLNVWRTINMALTSCKEVNEWLENLLL